MSYMDVMYGSLGQATNFNQANLNQNAAMNQQQQAQMQQQQAAAAAQQAQLNNLYGSQGFGGQTAYYAGQGAAYGRGTGGFTSRGGGGGMVDPTPNVGSGAGDYGGGGGGVMVDPTPNVGSGAGDYGGGGSPYFGGGAFSSRGGGGAFTGGGGGGWGGAPSPAPDVMRTLGYDPSAPIPSSGGGGGGGSSDAPAYTPPYENSFTSRFGRWTAPPQEAAPQADPGGGGFSGMGQLFDQGGGFGMPGSTAGGGQFAGRGIASSHYEATDPYGNPYYSGNAPPYNIPGTNVGIGGLGQGTGFRSIPR